MTQVPSVVFVCVKNAGKSQMAAGLMRAATTDVDVDSAGTAPGEKVNPLSAEVLDEVAVDITGERPKALTADMVARADLVVALGREAEVAGVPDGKLERWEIDEPSLRGIDGIERMRLVRDDIGRQVHDLVDRLKRDAAPASR